MIYINQKNYFALKDFVLYDDYSRIQGSKLEALYKLIQKRGELMQTNDPVLSGVKCLEFSKGEYIALIVTSFKKGSFYPCKLQKIHFQAL